VFFQSPELKPGAAVELFGRLEKSGGRNQQFDFIPEKINIIGPVTPIDEVRRNFESETKVFLYTFFET